jgi:hypothetical protein
MWAIVCAANLWLYYRDYYKPPWHPSLLLAWKYPVRAGQYFTAFLGAPLAQGYKNVGVSILFGIALLACLVMACVHLWRIRKQEHIADSATAWLVLCAFALASAFTATLGRMGFGIAQSQDSRYTGFSVYLVIGLLYLGAMVVRDVYRRGEILSAQARSALGLALVLIPHVTTEIGGYRQMWADRRVRLAGKAYTQLLNLFPSPQGVYMTSNVLTEKDFLDQMGYLRPGLVKSRDLTKIAGDASIGYGYFDALTPGDDSTWSAIGWATIPYRRDPAEVVLLAGEDGSGAAIAFAEGLSSGYRPDVARTLRNADYELSGWGFTFKSSDVPPGTRSISAWVYDPETGKAQRIGQTWGFMRKR